MAIRIMLSSADMGDVDERDFDLWTRYVAENVESATGVDAEVEQGRFGDAGEDVISGATEAQRDLLLSWLSVHGWEAFCAGPWDEMRSGPGARRHTERYWTDPCGLTISAEYAPLFRWF